MNFGIKITRRIDCCLRLGGEFADWYANANESIERWVSDVRHERAQPIRDMAAFLAIASPRVQVSRSVNIAKHYFLTSERLAATLGDVYRKLVEFDNYPDEYVWPRKTGAFFAALLGDAAQVVVDIHICRAFGFDDGFAMRDTIAGRSANDAIVSHITDIANTTGMRPCEVQACVWAGWIRFQGLIPGRLEL